MKHREPERHPDPKVAARQAREERLAAALRANLRRRKASRGGEGAAAAPGGKGGTGPEPDAS